MLATIASHADSRGSGISERFIRRTIAAPIRSSRGERTFPVVDEADDVFDASGAARHRSKVFLNRPLLLASRSRDHPHDQDHARGQAHAHSPRCEEEIVASSAMFM